MFDTNTFVSNTALILKKHRLVFPFQVSGSTFKTESIRELFFNADMDNSNGYGNGCLIATTENKKGKSNLDNVLFTPMRERDKRYEIIRRINFRAVENGIWLTNTLSGCTVLFVEWFNGHFSMMHLRPQRGVKHNPLSKIRGAYLHYMYKKYVDNTNFKVEDTLLTDCGKILYNSSARIIDQPKKYFLMQSGYQKSSVRSFYNVIITSSLTDGIKIYKQSFCSSSKIPTVEQVNLSYYINSDITPYYENRIKGFFSC